MLTQYDYFLAVVDHGGIRAAASALSVSQPAVTRGLQTLERELGAPLFERGRNRMELSRHGRMVLPRVRSLVAEHRRIVSDIAHTRGLAVDDRVVITASPLAMLSFAPRIFERALAVMSVTELVLRGSCGPAFDWSLHALLSGDADAAIAMQGSARLDEALEVVPLFQPDLRVVSRIGHPAARAGSSSLAALAAARWVLPTRCALPVDLVRSAFASEDFTPAHPSLEVDSWGAILDIVRSTDCLTLIPYHPAYLREDLRGIALLPQRFSCRPDPVGIITRRAARGHPATQTLIRLAREVVQHAESA